MNGKGPGRHCCKWNGIPCIEQPWPDAPSLTQANNCANGLLLCVIVILHPLSSKHHFPLNLQLATVKSTGWRHSSQRMIRSIGVRAACFAAIEVNQTCINEWSQLVNFTIPSCVLHIYWITASAKRLQYMLRHPGQASPIRLFVVCRIFETRQTLARAGLIWIVCLSSLCDCRNDLFPKKILSDLWLEPGTWVKKGEKKAKLLLISWVSLFVICSSCIQKFPQCQNFLNFLFNLLLTELKFWQQGFGHNVRRNLSLPPPPPPPPR